MKIPKPLKGAFPVFANGCIYVFYNVLALIL